MIIPELIEESDTPITADHLNAIHQSLETIETGLTETIDATADVEGRKAIRAKRSVIRKTKNECPDLLARELKYTKQLDILDVRNSYSKTDPDATFMRMKENLIRNGQLKACYNLQVANNNQFILGFDLYPNPTDTRTLAPFLNTMLEKFQYLTEKIVGDAGYGSEANYEMIQDAYERTALIPYNTYYKQQKKKHKMDDMHPANWTYDADNDRYICPDGRDIRFER